MENKNFGQNIMGTPLVRKAKAKSMGHINKEVAEEEEEPCLRYGGAVCAFLIIPGYVLYLPLKSSNTHCYSCFQTVRVTQRGTLGYFLYYRPEIH
jgi:hypothetical protein